MIRLLSYVVKTDAGFAPNPFGGYCTLAACTPNHLGVRAKPGEWFLGHETAKRGGKLVYAMRVSEVLSFDEYHRDPRFQCKKPRFDRSWREACGDNIYHRAESGEWIQDRSHFHNSPDDFRTDTKHPRVFIAERFFYFGESAVQIPDAYSDLIWSRQGCRWSDRPGLIVRFLSWLESAFEPGIHGDPRDKDITACSHCSPSGSSATGSPRCHQPNDRCGTDFLHQQSQIPDEDMECSSG